MPISLPTQPNVPPTNISAYTIMIAGQKKIGKTSFAAAFPKPYILQFEPGNSRALPVLQTDVTNWEQTKELVQLLEKNPLYCDTLIVDDVPSMYMYARNWLCNKMKISYPDELSQGKGWNMVNVEFADIISRLQALPCGKIYTSHSEVKQADTRTGKTVATLETKMGRGADTIMDARTQIVGFIMYNEKKERVLIIEGDDYLVKAGQGLAGHFLTETGERIKEIPLGKTPAEGYANFVAAFNNKLHQKNSQPATKLPALDPNANVNKKFTIKKP